MEAVWNFLSENWLPAVVIPLVGGIAGAIVTFVVQRQPKSHLKPPQRYFKQPDLLSPPTERPAYSDRMAYVLAEMSALAYCQFESLDSIVEEATEKAKSLASDCKQADVREFLDGFATEIMTGGRWGRGVLEKVLDNSGFELLDTINVGSTQGFVCRRKKRGQPPYLVVAFRGTESKVSDWLTDSHCVPTEEGVHTGFRDAFERKEGEDGKTVSELVSEILRDEGTRPLFITGHSLGGALALLATKRLAPKRDSTSCYTFGAPRIANYEFFRDVKTPVFRVVNSSDIVPRVPPGPLVGPTLMALRILSSLVSPFPVASAALDRLERFLDKLNGYRHFGDLRYLTDVAEGRFDDVRLLTSPPAIDRMLWMGRSLVKGVHRPVKSHGIALYRRKLLVLAERRNRS